MPPAEEAISAIRVEFPRFNRKEIVNAVVEFAGTLPPDVQGAIIGGLPETRKPEYAQFILQLIAEGKGPDLKLAAKPAPKPKRPKR